MGPSSSEALSQDEIDNLLSTLGVDKSKMSRLASPPHESRLTREGESNLPAAPAEKRNYKLYNFRRPDKFSKDHLRALQAIHEAFARQVGMLLSAYLRMNVEIDVVSVDQLTYDEFVRSMPSPITVTILEMTPLAGQSLMGFSHEISSSMIDRMLGGPGISEPKPRELTDIEQSLIKRVIDRTVECLEEAWHSFLTVSIDVIGIEDSYNLIQVATPGEIVALITFEVTLGNRDSGLMSLSIPYPVLESVLGQLSAQHIFQRQTEDIPEEEKQKLLTKLHYAKTPVEVYLAGTQLSIGELMELSVGDVIKLDRLATSDLLVNVNHRPKFYGRPGKARDKLAVYITDSITNEETIEGFGIND
jgi:flagellar motor switch protein FliM